MKEKPLPFSREDLPAFCFWWLLGIGAGAFVALLLALLSSLDFDGPAFPVCEVLGGISGWQVWWWARNP